MALLAACGADAVRPQAGPADVDAAIGRSAVWLIRRGWHTELALQAADLDPPLSSVQPDFPGAHYFAFGFADRRYIMATHQNAANLLLAPLPGPGLMLVSALAADPSAYYSADEALPLSLTQAQRAALRRFISESFALQAGELPPPTLAGRYPNNRFYLSSKRYDGLYTCNTWTAEALQSGGLPFPTFGVLFASQVWQRAQALVARPAEFGTAP
jgi:hypothetical protein